MSITTRDSSGSNDPARDASGQGQRRKRVTRAVTAMAMPGVMLPFSFAIDKSGIHWLHADDWIRLMPIAVACAALIAFVTLRRPAGNSRA